MRINERMGLVYTALFLTVSVAVITQNSATLMAWFRGETNVQAVDDIFTVRAGRDQRLFVLRNDVNSHKIDATAVRLVSKPGCGIITQTGGSFVYSASTACSGYQGFSYCLFTGSQCTPAKVALRLVETRDPVDTVESGPATDLSGLQAQVDINSQDLEITNVHLGKVARSETTTLPVAGQKLARVAVEPSIAITRPDPLPRAGIVTGTFDINDASDFGRSSEPLQSVAQLSTENAPLDDSSPDSATARPSIGIALPRPPVITLRAVNFPTSRPRGLGGAILAQDPGVQLPETQQAIDESPFGTACSAYLRARALDGAMVELTLKAPCLPNSRVLIRHAKLSIAMQTGHTGDLIVTVPALEAKARFAVRIGTNDVLKATVDVPQLKDIERVAIQWEGDFDLQLHALEYGAKPGSSGHIWLGHTRAYDQATRLGSGFSARIGDSSLQNPMMVEVYSLPISRNTQVGVVEMLVSANATDKSCGKTHMIQSFRSTAGRLVGASGFQFRADDCGSTPQSILLNNAVRDVIIAAR
jgi:hypothetical protein